MITFQSDIFKFVQVSDNRIICVAGIGKLFYEQGFPISLAVAELKKQDIEVSMLHVADELLKNEWKPQTVLIRIETDFQDSILGEDKIDISVLKEFVYAIYERQRELIFDYLWGTHSNGESHLREYLTKT